MSDLSDFSWANKIKNGFFFSRSGQRQKSLGVIAATQPQRLMVRDPKLEQLDAYFENRQYDHLLPFESDKDADGSHIPLRRRKPKIVFPYGRTLAARVTAKLIGQSVWPKFEIKELPDDEEFFRLLIEHSELKTELLEPFRKILNTGCGYLRFYLSDGAFKFQFYDAKHCYPTYQENGELELVRVRYVYEDAEDVDSMGRPKAKWYQVDFGTMSEILYDNPEYVEGQDPEFSEVTRQDHELGFVQGQWFSTTGKGDGYGLISDILQFIDEFNYSLSQSSKAVAYNQDPQLAVSKLTEDEMGVLIRDSAKAWNLGREGDAKYLETNLSGVERAIELRDKVGHNVQDITRIVMLDPEKIVGSAQSGRAMEILHGPLKDLIDELRGPMGKGLLDLVVKMGLAVLISAQRGIAVPFEIPPGFKLQGLPVLKWPAIFPETVQDQQQRIQLAVSASTANIISRRTATRFVSDIFGIDDVDAEVNEINSQPVINPFGGF